MSVPYKIRRLFARRRKFYRARMGRSISRDDWEMADCYQYAMEAIEVMFREVKQAYADPAGLTQPPRNILR